MLEWKKKVRKNIYLLVDAVTLASAFYVSHLIYYLYRKSPMNISQSEEFTFFMVFAIFMIMMSESLNLYEDTMRNYGKLSFKILGKSILALAATQVIAGAVLFYMKIPMSRVFLIIFDGVIVGLFLVNRFVLQKLFRSGQYYKNNRNILMLGYSDKGEEYIEEMKKHDYLNYNIIGCVSVNDEKRYKDIWTIGKLENLASIVTCFVVDEITVAVPVSKDDRLLDEIDKCQSMGITVNMLLNIVDNGKSVKTTMVGHMPMLKFHLVSLDESQVAMKRLLDVVGALVGMVIFGLAYIIVGPLIVLESPGPVIFKQDRVGKNGRIFQVWKFRSMGVDAEARKSALMANNEMSGHMFKMTNDPRITKIGAFIRKTSIDELPQFWNVFKGDMSLVGTRPPTVSEVEAYEIHHRKRISITPGITGNWQVSGRSDIADFEQVVKLDEDYIRDWTIWKDLEILAKTVRVVLGKKGSK